MLLLQVGVRGLARFKDEDGLPLLDRIIAQEPLFAEVANNSRTEGGVKRLTGWVAAARKQIIEAAMIEAA